MHILQILNPTNTQINDKNPKEQDSQLLAKLGGVLRGAKGVDEPLERGNGGVDLENAGGHGLGRVLLAIDEVSPRGTIGPPTFQILKAHIGSLSLKKPNFFPEKIRTGNSRKFSLKKKQKLVFGYRDPEDPAGDGELGLKTGAKTEATIEERERVLNCREREGV